VEIAMKLATSRGKLLRLKENIVKRGGAAAGTGMFATSRVVRDMESMFCLMWEKTWRRGDAKFHHLVLARAQGNHAVPSFLQASRDTLTQHRLRRGCSGN